MVVVLVVPPTTCSERNFSQGGVADRKVRAVNGDCCPVVLTRWNVVVALVVPPATSSERRFEQGGVKEDRARAGKCDCCTVLLTQRNVLVVLVVPAATTSGDSVCARGCYRQKSAGRE